MIAALALAAYALIGLGVGGYGLRAAGKRGHRFETDETVLIVLMLFMWPIVITATTVMTYRNARGKNR